MEWLNPTTLVLFFLYTLVTLIAAFVGRIWVNNMGDKTKNLAVEAVTLMVTDAVKDARAARIDLITEREIRAKLEGKVEIIMTHTTEEKRRADLAYAKLSKQDSQIEKLYREVRELTSNINAIRERLAKVEEEKRWLEKDLSTQNEEYRKLMATVQERIDKAVAEVRDELRLHYEGLITDLQAEIRKRDEEIVSLKKLLEEKSHEDSTSPATAPNTDAPAESADTGTGSDGSPIPDAGNSGDNPGGGNASS